MWAGLCSPSGRLHGSPATAWHLGQPTVYGGFRNIERCEARRLNIAAIAASLATAVPRELLTDAHALERQLQFDPQLVQDRLERLRVGGSGVELDP